MRSSFEKTVLSLSGVCGAKDWESVTAALEGTVGVREVRVSLFRANAVVVHAPECASGALVRAIEDAGFLAVLEERSDGSSPKEFSNG